MVFFFVSSVKHFIYNYNLDSQDNAFQRKLLYLCIFDMLRTYITPFIWPVLSIEIHWQFSCLMRLFLLLLCFSLEVSWCNEFYQLLLNEKKVIRFTGALNVQFNAMRANSPRASVLWPSGPESLHCASFPPLLFSQSLSFQCQYFYLFVLSVAHPVLHSLPPDRKSRDGAS